MASSPSQPSTDPKRDFRSLSSLLRVGWYDVDRMAVPARGVPVPKLFKIGTQVFDPDRITSYYDGWDEDGSVTIYVDGRAPFRLVKQEAAVFLDFIAPWVEDSNSEPKPEPKSKRNSSPLQPDGMMECLMGEAIRRYGLHQSA
jgi:hypothetical protein